MCWGIDSIPHATGWYFRCCCVEYALGKRHYENAVSVSKLPNMFDLTSIVVLNFSSDAKSSASKERIFFFFAVRRFAQVKTLN